MNNIDIYRNSNIITLRKTPSIICSWITILIISSVIFVIFSLTFEYKKYLVYDGYVKNNYVEFYADSRYFDKKTDYVIIGEEKYQYDVVALEEYVYNLGEVEYWKVVLDIKLPHNLIVENNRFKLNFALEETTLFKSLVKKIKKGIEQ